MSDLIVEVCEIKEIKMHPGADLLEIAVVKGWDCIVKKGQYKVGDKVVYFPIDSVLPEDLADRLGVRNYLAGQKKNRVKCAKLRNEMSYGLIIDNEGNWEVGTDVAEAYGITKYTPPPRFSAGDAAPEDPLFFKFTDIQNVNNYPDVFEKGETVIITEKIDGCFREDQKVMLANGEYEEISKINNGDMVISYNENNKDFEPKKVINVFSEYKNKGWVKLYFDDGREIVCTEDHLFLTKNRGWVKSIDLIDTDELVSIID